MADGFKVSAADAALLEQAADAEGDSLSPTAGIDRASDGQTMAAKQAAKANSATNRVSWKRAKRIQREKNALLRDGDGSIPLDPLHEQYCAEYLFRGSIIKAFKAVFTIKDGTPDNNIAYRAKRTHHLPAVKNRIAYLQKQRETDVIAGADRLTRSSLDALQMARDNGDYEGILKAVDRLARLGGHYIDRKAVEFTVADIGIYLGVDKPNEIKDITPKAPTIEK